MTATRPYISHLRYGDGVILIGYSRSGRFRKPADTWMRLRFLTALLPAELKTQRRPFRLIRSLRAAAVKAWTFDRKLRQSPALSSTATVNVGKVGDNGLSPLSGETSTRCASPQSGQRSDDISTVNDRQSLSI